jgi:hypothetical protein
MNYPPGWCKKKDLNRFPASPAPAFSEIREVFLFQKSITGKY